MPNERKLRVIRRGLVEFPKLKASRHNRRTIRIVSVGRLEEKKGLFYQIDIFKDLKTCGVNYNARIVGSGPLDQALRDYRDKSGLHNDVEFWGQLSFDAVQEQLALGGCVLFYGPDQRQG